MEEEHLRMYTTKERFMKRIKNIVAALMVLVALFTCITLNVSAANDATASGYGFAVNTSYYERIGWTGATAMKQTIATSSGTVYGYVKAVVIWAAKKGTTTNDTWAAIYHLSVQTENFIGFNLVGGQAENWSYPQLIQLETQLSSPRTYVKSTPADASGMTSYSAGTDNISSSTAVTKNALIIDNTSSTSANKFHVDYDYKAEALGHSSSRNAYLYNNSQQRAVMFYTKPKNNTAAGFLIKLTSKFSIMTPYSTDYLTTDKTTTWNYAAG
jgi:hypothetical protein